MSDTQAPRRFYCWFDSASGRYVLQGRELHCGDCFQVRFIQPDGTDGPWFDVRIEMTGRRWYLIGLPPGKSSQPDAYEARLYAD